MQLTGLLEDARRAAPDSRILLRDPIAAFGPRALAGVTPWLEDPVLSAFAVRVILRVGEQGDPATAASLLRRARTQVPEGVRGDVSWALERLRLAGR